MLHVNGNSAFVIKVSLFKSLPRCYLHLQHQVQTSLTCLPHCLFQRHQIRSNTKRKIQIVSLLVFVGAIHISVAIMVLMLHFTEEFRTRPYVVMQKRCAWNKSFLLGNRLKFSQFRRSPEKIVMTIFWKSLPVKVGYLKGYLSLLCPWKHCVRTSLITGSKGNLHEESLQKTTGEVDWPCIQEWYCCCCNYYKIIYL